MAASGECGSGTPEPEVMALTASIWLAPVSPIIDIVGLLLVGEAQGLPFLLGQENQNETASYSNTLNFIRDMLATYPLLTVVAVVIALLNLVPGGLVVLCRPRMATVDFDDPEQAGNDRVRMAMLRGLMGFMLLVLACLLMTGFASNSIYSGSIYKLPEHTKHFQSIISSYEDDVLRTAECVVEGQRKYIEDSLDPSYAGCKESLVKDVGTFNLQGRASLSAITEYLDKLSPASEAADALEVSALRLRQMRDQLEPLLQSSVPEQPAEVACDAKRQPLCTQLLSSWEKLRAAVQTLVLAPPDVSGTIKLLRNIVEEDRVGSMKAVITQYSNMAGDPNKYMTEEIKGDWQRLLAANVRPQGQVQEYRISLVLKRFARLVGWVGAWADSAKTPTLHLAANLSQLNTVHLAALTCAWGLSVFALILGFTGERRTSRLLVRLAEGVFACFVLQVHVVVSLMLFLGLVGKRAVCEPGLEPWSEATRTAIGDYVNENPKSKWMDGLPDVVLRCHAKHTVYQAFRTESQLGADKSVAAPPELAHAMYALETSAPINTSALFQGLRTNLLDEDNLSLLKTIVGLPLAALGTSEVQKVKGDADNLAFWLQNTSDALQSTIGAISPATQESDQKLASDLVNRKKGIDESLVVLKAAIPEWDAYLGAENNFKQSGVVQKEEEADKQLKTLYEARTLLATSDSSTCLELKSITLTKNISNSIATGVRTQIGKCAYLSKAYNYSLYVVCDEIVYSMNAFWAATFLFCLVNLIYIVVAAHAGIIQRRMDAFAEEEEEEVVAPTTTAGTLA